MAEITGAALERLARSLADKDGFEWQMEFKMPLPHGAIPQSRPILDGAGRERYLTLARQQLAEGTAGA